MIEPQILAVRPSAAQSLGFEYNLPIFTTSVNELGLPAPVDAAFQRSGLVFHVEQYLPRIGVDPSHLIAAPRGSVDMTWSVDFFGSDAGAKAVDGASKANLVGRGFHELPIATPLGIQFFEREEPASAGLTVRLINQVYYFVEHNVMIAVADTGKFQPGKPQSDATAVFSTVRRELEPLTLMVRPTLSRTEAGAEYINLALAVNTSLSQFASSMSQWTNATTGQEAEMTAKPSIVALDGVELRLGGLAARYPRARQQFLKTVGALEFIRGDLVELTYVATPENSDWPAGFQSALSALTDASNATRSALGLPPAGP